MRLDIRGGARSGEREKKREAEGYEGGEGLKRMRREDGRST
jgi:hypothetical protein